MQIATRDGKIYESKVLLSQRLLYHTLLGRLFLKLLISSSISKKIGAKLDSEKSKKRIKKFVKKNNINCDDYILDDIHSFNDFFSRKIKPDRRPIDKIENHLISPCDCKVTAYSIDEGLRLHIKNSVYTLSELVHDDNIVKQYQGGTCLVLRLCVDDYHRYCYIDDGTKEDNVFIPGVLHTVNPIANDHYKIYSQNQREYTVLHTKNFSDVIQIEVGALLVGKIVNYQEKGEFKRGDEKGKFLYGGSTIVLLLNKDIKIDSDIIENSKKEIETIVRMGEKIGEINETEMGTV